MACIRKRRGKWVVDYRDGAGIRHWKTCETRREAEDFLDQERPRTRQWHQARVDSNVTIMEYASRWLAQIKPSVKPRTVAGYKKIIDDHVLPTLGDAKVIQLHRAQVKDFLAFKLSQGLARNTVRNIHAAVRAMLHAAIDDGILLSNPAERLGRQLRLLTSKATRQEEIKAMTKDQRRRFLEVAAGTMPNFYPMFFTLAGTGMRLGEVLALQWGDVDVQNRESRVARAFSQGKLETPKSGHGRTVDLSQALADTLERLELERKAETLRRGWREIPPWVFCSEAGTPYDERNVRRAMYRVLKKAELPGHFSPHCLRHTYASLLLQQGESPAYVQRQLGHASIQLTVDTYGKWLPMGNKAAVDRLDDVPSGSKMVATAGERSSKPSELIERIGAPDTNRTCDPRFRKPLLYPTELRGRRGVP
jgi:integrase